MAPKTHIAWALALVSLFSPGTYAYATFPDYFLDVRYAHAALGIVTFAIIFPAGAILMRSGAFSGLVWAHAAFQLVGYACLCYVFGSGLWICYLYNYFYIDPHIEIGMILFGLATLQPFIGTIHHWMFKRYNRRTFMSAVHILLGRSLILIGMINGGLGLFLALNTTAPPATPTELKAYGIIVSLLYFAYMFTIAYFDAKASREQQWLAETDGAKAKKEMGIEAKKLGVYEDKESQ